MTRTVVESKTKTAIIGFDQPFCVIGERINPTGRKILNEELERGDFSRVEADAIAQRPVLGKTAYKERIRRVVRTKAFQKKAANTAMGFPLSPCRTAIIL